MEFQPGGGRTTLQRGQSNRSHQSLLFSYLHRPVSRCRAGTILGVEPLMGKGKEMDLLQQFVRITNRYRQVRAAKVIQHGEVHTNDLAISIE